MEEFFRQGQQIQLYCIYTYRHMYTMFLLRIYICTLCFYRNNVHVVDIIVKEGNPALLEAKYYCFVCKIGTIFTQTSERLCSFLPLCN